MLTVFDYRIAIESQNHKNKFLRSEAPILKSQLEITSVPKRVKNMFEIKTFKFCSPETQLQKLSSDDHQHYFKAPNVWLEVDRHHFLCLLRGCNARVFVQTQPLVRAFSFGKVLIKTTTIC